jgi:hypothetical protein
MMFSKFRKLVNLYLDKEISEDQLSLLKVEINANKEKRKLFSFYFRLHQATKLALVRMRAGPSQFEQIDNINSELFSEAKTITVDFGSGEIIGSATDAQNRSGKKKSNFNLIFGAMAASVCLSFVIISAVFMGSHKDNILVETSAEFVEKTEPVHKPNLENNELVVLASNQEVIKKEIIDGMNELAEYTSGLDEFGSRIARDTHAFKHVPNRFNKDLILRANEELRYYPVYDDESFRPVLLGPAGSRGNQFKSDLTSLRFQR